MKKLTAGIFTVLMGLVSVNAADAAVASKLYVDQFVGENGSITGKVTALETTVGDENSGLVQDVATLQTDLGKLQGGELTINKDAILTDMIKNGQVTEEKLSTDLQNKVNAAATQTYTDAELAKKVNKADAKLDEVGATGSYIELVSQLDGKVSATKKEFVAEINEASKDSTVAPQTKAVKSYVDGAISTQGTQVTNLSGRVGALETAVNNALDDEKGILAQANSYADQAEADAISAAAADATSKANAAQSAAEGKVTELANGAVKANTEAIAALDTTYVSESEMDAFEAANTTAIENAKTAAITAAGTAADGKISAALADYTTTTDMNTALGLKADKSDTYTKAQVDAAVKVNADAIDALDTTYVSETEMDTFEAANTAAIAGAKSEAITAANGYTDTAISNLNLNELSRVPAECSVTGKYCVLTSDGTNYLWEVIERATDEVQPTGTAIPAVTQ